jgi:hypothetical protein
MSPQFLSPADLTLIEKTIRVELDQTGEGWMVSAALVNTAAKAIFDALNIAHTHAPPVS